MQAHEVKEGMRVVWSYGNFTDSGTVVLYDDELIITANDQQYVYAKWDSDGAVQQANLHTLEAIPPYVSEKKITEQQAVELLLNLGYTLTKQY